MTDFRIERDVSSASAAGTGAERGGAATVALLATLGLALTGWIVTVPRMAAMDMGVSTTLGSFGFFVSVWVPMMAAIMLPGVAPSVVRLAGSTRAALDILRYVGSYLAVWALFGVVVFAVYRPHGTTVAGAIAVAAGAYELTPMKRRCRNMGQDRSSGLGLGAWCVGSSAGPMLMMVAFGAMSLAWMAAAAGIVLLQKLLPPRAVIDVPVALAMIGLGFAEFVK